MRDQSRQTALAALFSHGVLKRPDGVTSVHLFRALAELCGHASFSHNAHTAKIKKAIGEYTHYVFVLVDGLGSSLKNSVPARGWFAQAERTDMSSVYPSTTAVALTSQATGLWPAEHGVTGWHTYLPERDLTVLPLKASERFSGKTLKALGLPFREVVQPESVIPLYRGSKRVFMKKSIRGGDFAKWAFFGITKTGSGTLSQSFDRLRDHVRRTEGPAFSHMYIDDLDSMSHRHGPASEGVQSVLSKIDRELSTLRDTAGEHVRIVVTADHGHIDIDPERYYLLHQDDPLLLMLKAPPSGESRNPIFHVLPGRKTEFEDAFTKRFGADFLLAKSGEIRDEKLMGPKPLAEVTRSRIGNFVGIAKKPSAIEFIPRGSESKRHIGMHGGLSNQEIAVSLFLL
jgi:hypothetical protein